MLSIPDLRCPPDARTRAPSGGPARPSPRHLEHEREDGEDGPHGQAPERRREVDVHEGQPGGRRHLHRQGSPLTNETAAAAAAERGGVMRRDWCPKDKPEVYLRISGCDVIEPSYHLVDPFDPSIVHRLVGGAFSRVALPCVLFYSILFAL